MPRPIVPLMLACAAITTASGFAQLSPGRDGGAGSGAPDAAPTLQALMQANSGSLLAATSAMPQDPTRRSNPIGMAGVPSPAPHVYKQHDLINIVVQENSSSASTGSTDLEKTVNLDAKVDAFVKLNLAKLSVQGGAEGANPPEVKLEGNRTFKGDGSYDRSDTVTLRLEAEVVDVKPNGTMVVQARRHIKTDEEEIAVSLTGVCRVEDVDASNSVLSTNLHNLDLQKVTKGAVRDQTRRGFFARLLDFINPF